MTDDRADREMLALLGDSGCRTILGALLTADEPVAVAELSADIDVPESTLYRKLDRLTATPLVVARSTVSTGGHPRTHYEPGVSKVTVRFDGAISLAVEQREEVDVGVETVLGDRNR